MCATQTMSDSGETAPSALGENNNALLGCRGGFRGNGIHPQIPFLCRLGLQSPIYPRVQSPACNAALI